MDAAQNQDSLFRFGTNLGLVEMKRGLLCGDLFGSKRSATHVGQALAFDRSPLCSFGSTPFAVWDGAVNNTLITTISIQLSPTGAIGGLIPGSGLPHSSQGCSWLRQFTSKRMWFEPV